MPTKKSFVLMIEKGFIFLGVSQICVIFAVPAPGKMMFILYNILYGIALGGISSALINLVFDYVPIEREPIHWLLLNPLLVLHVI